MHTLDVTLRDHIGASLMELASASIARPRIHLIGTLDRLQAAGNVLRWIRQATAHRVREPATWALLQKLLDTLDEDVLPVSPRALLVVAGLQLLAHLGYEINLDACVVCGRGCPQDRSAYVDPVRGGLVCRMCGGAGRMLTGSVRQRVLLAMRGSGVLEEDDVDGLIDMVDAALLAHASVRPGGSRAAVG